MESNLKIQPYKQDGKDEVKENPKQGDAYGVSFNYKPLFLSGSLGYDNFKTDSYINMKSEIPFLEKYHLGLGVTSYDAKHGTPTKVANSYATTPFLSAGYNMTNPLATGLRAGVEYKYGQIPFGTIGYTYSNENTNLNAGINYAYGKPPQFNVMFKHSF